MDDVCSLRTAHLQCKTPATGGLRWVKFVCILLTHGLCRLTFLLKLDKLFWPLRTNILLTLRSLTLYIYGAPILEVSRSHNDAAQSVGLLWTSDQFVAETSTWQHTTLTTDKYPCPRWNSNPRSQQVSGRRPLTCWERGFESHRGHGYLSVVSVVCCQVEVSAKSWSLVQRSPTECAASLCVI